MILLAIVATVWLTNYYKQYKSSYLLYQVFTNNPIHGMIVSSPVEMLGIEVGSVQKIELLKPDLARIVFSVDKKTPMTDKVVAKIIAKGLSGKGLTGYVFIELSAAKKIITPFNPDNDNRLPTLSLLPWHNSSFDKGLHEINKNFSKITLLIQSLLTPQMIKSSHQLINDLQNSIVLLNKKGKQLDKLFQDIQKITQALKPLSHTSNKLLTNIDTQLLPEFYKTLLTIRGVAKQTHTTVEKIEPDPSIILRGAKANSLGPGEQAYR